MDFRIIKILQEKDTFGEFSFTVSPFSPNSPTPIGVFPSWSHNNLQILMHSRDHKKLDPKTNLLQIQIRPRSALILPLHDPPTPGTEPSRNGDY